MNISILLPYKENFTANNAGAVSLFVSDINNKSKFKKTTTIFGNTEGKKILSDNYKNLNLDKSIFRSTSKQYVESFLNYLDNCLYLIYIFSSLKYKQKIVKI